MPSKEIQKSSTKTENTAQKWGFEGKSPREKWNAHVKESREVSGEWVGVMYANATGWILSWLRIVGKSETCRWWRRRDTPSPDTIDTLSRSAPTFPVRGTAHTGSGNPSQTLSKGIWQFRSGDRNISAWYLGFTFLTYLNNSKKMKKVWSFFHGNRHGDWKVSHCRDRQSAGSSGHSRSGMLLGNWIMPINWLTHTGDLPGVIISHVMNILGR